MPGRKTICTTILAACAAVILTGCMPKMTIEEMKAKMPERPDELDRLDAFVGKWQSEGEVKFAMLDEPIKISGTSEAQWDNSRWFVVSRETSEMEHFGESNGLGAWTYDIHDKEYRSTWVDSMGMVALGHSEYDEKTNTWDMEAKSHGPWGKSTLKGWVKFTDADTMEWWMVEYYGLMKVMEMSGTDKRVR
jgi:hypothetical protein